MSNSCVKSSLCKLKDASRFIKTVFIALISGIFGGVFSIWIFFRLCPPSVIIQQSDAISVANTFIVFTTLMFVIATIGVSIYGVWVAKSSAREKTVVMNEHIDDVISKICANKEYLSNFSQAALKNEVFLDSITNIIDEFTKLYVQSRSNIVDENRDGLMNIEEEKNDNINK